MVRLRHQELKALSEALLGLYSPVPHADFPPCVSAILRRRFSFDCLAHHEIVDNQNQRALFSPEITFDIQAFETYLDQHPTWNAFTRDHVESCAKISDFMNRVSAHHSCRAYLRIMARLANGTNRRLTLRMPLPCSIWVYSMANG